MRIIKFCYTALAFIFYTTLLSAQQNHLDVEGHSKMRGNIDINHMDDTTSVFIGRNAGINTEFSSLRFNTFVGANAGPVNTSGKDNSFFGRRAGFSNTSGERNSFFGLRAGSNNTISNDNSFFGFDAGRDNTEGGERNSFFGKSAGLKNTSGIRNAFFGFDAGLQNTTGTRNTFIGYGADQLNVGDSLDRATAIGYNAKVDCSHCLVLGGTGIDSVRVGIGTTAPEKTLEVLGDTKISGSLTINHMDDTTSIFIGLNTGENTIFSENRFITFFGSEAGKSNITGTYNSFFGASAGKNNTFGTTNSFFGESAGSTNTTGSGNSFFGRSTGMLNLDGNFNSFFGSDAGMKNSEGESNAFFGKSAGLDNTSGSDNVFIGSSAGLKNTTGTRNTFIGHFARQLTEGDSLDRAIAIGYNARVKCSNCAVVGGTGSDAVKVGIGTDTPQETLDVRGKLIVKASIGSATFQSSGFNSFISLANNDGAKSTSIGYFDNSAQEYFFIDVPPHGGAFDPELVISSGGNIGIGDDTPDVKLDVVGDINYTGDIVDVSDIRLKENIVPIDHSLEKILRLNGFVYNLIDDQDRSAGVSAQDVQKVLPEAVSEIDNGYLGVDYTQLVPLLIEGMKEQQSQISDLKEQIAALGSLKDELADIRKILSSQPIESEDE